MRDCFSVSRYSFLMRSTLFPTNTPAPPPNRVFLFQHFFKGYHGFPMSAIELAPCALSPCQIRINYSVSKLYFTSFIHSTYFALLPFFTILAGDEGCLLHIIFVLFAFKKYSLSFMFLKKLKL